MNLHGLPVIGEPYAPAVVAHPDVIKAIDGIRSMSGREAVAWVLVVGFGLMALAFWIRAKRWERVAGAWRRAATSWGEAAGWQLWEDSREALVLAMERPLDPEHFEVWSGIRETTDEGVGSPRATP